MMNKTKDNERRAVILGACLGSRQRASCGRLRRLRFIRYYSRSPAEGRVVVIIRDEETGGNSLRELGSQIVGHDFKHIAYDLFEKTLRRKLIADSFMSLPEGQGYG